MRLGIISDSFHYYDAHKRLYNLTVLREQFECWTNLFDEVFICAPLLSGSPPVTHTPYARTNIKLLPVVAAGGDGIVSKLHLVRQLPGWARQLKHMLNQVDAVHVRCPNNISIPGIFLLERFRGYRQALYTGNWNGYAGEPITYRWQRWFLRTCFQGPVAVYGEWLEQPAHIVSSFSPSYGHDVWHAETEQVQAKIARLSRRNELERPLHLISVGWLNRNKNQQLIIKALPFLQEQGFEAELHLLGDGDKRESLLTLARELGVISQVHFYGHVSQEIVRSFYRKADFVIQPSFTEGFTKVPIEAMFHGAVPLLSHINLNPQVVDNGQRGRTFSPVDVKSLADCILGLVTKPGELIQLIEQGRVYAKKMTLEAWQDHIQLMLEKHWQVKFCTHSDKLLTKVNQQ